MMRVKTSLKTRLMLVLGLMIALMAAVGSINIHSSRHVSQQVNHIREKIYPVAISAMDLQLAVERALATIMRAAAAGQTELLRPLKENERSQQEIFARILDLVSDSPVMTDKLHRIIRLQDTTHKIGLHWVASTANGESDQSKELGNSYLKNQRQLKIQISDLANSGGQQFSGAMRDISRGTETLVKQNSLIFLFGLLGFMALTAKLYGSITGPIQSLLQVISEIRAEKTSFSKRVEIDTNDEIGQLGAAFNGMLVDLDKSQRKIIEYTLELEHKVKARTQQLQKEKEALAQSGHDLEKAISEAENANRAKSDFLANMSHELRTPLNHIIGFTELVVDKHFGDLSARQEEYLNDVLYSSTHLLSLINDILDLSKIEAGKQDLERAPLDLTQVLKSSLNIIKEKALKHDIRLKTHFDGVPSQIMADERKLKQILYNLLSNALKYTPDGGEVRLAAVCRPVNPSRTPAEGKNGNRHIEITVTDNGAGIAADDIEKIFNPFEQAKDGNRKARGTGLGLSLTKNLVELHGGRIWAQSGGLGRGSQFHFTIPI